MNVSQFHEQLRRELLRRIQRGTLSGTLLARQTGLNPAHISNFLHGKRRLSLTALDQILTALDLKIENLLPHARSRDSSSAPDRIPLVAQSIAIQKVTESVPKWNWSEFFLHGWRWTGRRGECGLARRKNRENAREGEDFQFFDRGR